MTRYCAAQPRAVAAARMEEMLARLRRTGESPRGAVHRPGQFQDRQRHPGPSVRRSAAAGPVADRLRAAVREPDTVAARPRRRRVLRSCRPVLAGPDEVGAAGAARARVAIGELRSTSTGITSVSARASGSRSRARRSRAANVRVPRGCRRQPALEELRTMALYRAKADGPGTRSASSRPRWMPTRAGAAHPGARSAQGAGGG